VEILKNSTNEELSIMLLQLVQCLRYEKSGSTSELFQFLIERFIIFFKFFKVYFIISKKGKLLKL
jgi:hypothetical protein